MGQKKAYTLLNGAVAAGAGTAQNVGGYQKAFYGQIRNTSGTPDFTVQFQYRAADGSTWIPFHEEVVTANLPDPIKLTEFPWTIIRAEITAYTSGTVSAEAYLV